jgi:hypothetical protein
LPSCTSALPLFSSGDISQRRRSDLNDAFRRSFSGGKVTMTAGVYALPDMVKAAALQKAATFDEFNDPHGEHDFGSLDSPRHMSDITSWNWQVTPFAVAIIF